MRDSDMIYLKLDCRYTESLLLVLYIHNYMEPADIGKHIVNILSDLHLCLLDLLANKAIDRTRHIECKFIKIK